jgi:hypothetical protein
MSHVLIINRDILRFLHVGEQIRRGTTSTSLADRNSDRKCLSEQSTMCRVIFRCPLMFTVPEVSCSVGDIAWNISASTDLTVNSCHLRPRVSASMAVFWDVTPCILVDSYVFEEHASCTVSIYPEDWVTRFLEARMHGIIFQKKTISLQY